MKLAQVLVHVWHSLKCQFPIVLFLMAMQYSFVLLLVLLVFISFFLIVELLGCLQLHYYSVTINISLVITFFFLWDYCLGVCSPKLSYQMKRYKKFYGSCQVLPCYPVRLCQFLTMPFLYEYLFSRSTQALGLIFLKNLCQFYQYIMAP